MYHLYPYKLVGIEAVGYIRVPRKDDSGKRGLNIVVLEDVPVGRRYHQPVHLLFLNLGDPFIRLNDGFRGGIGSKHDLAGLQIPI